MGRTKELLEKTKKLLTFKSSKKEVKSLEKKVETTNEKGDTTVKEAKAQGTTFYVVQNDTLFIGTRGECEAHIGKKVGIFEMDAKTKAQIETSAQIIRDGLSITAEAEVKAKAEAKAQASVGKGPVKLTLSGEAEAKVAAAATATIDLSKLMVELGVNVSAGVKVKGSASLDLKLIEITAILEASANVSAGAKAKMDWTGVSAEAKAVAEAKASLGVEFKTAEFSIKGHKFQVALKPSITAYAKAEAKAAAAAGAKTGVSLGASAAVGLRGTIEATLIGHYPVDSLDKFNRETDANTGKSVLKKDLSGKDLATIGMEVEIELAVGASAELMPINFSIEKDPATGLNYAVGEGKFKVDIPGIISGPAGVGLGIKIYIKVLEQMIEDVKKMIYEAVKAYVKDTLSKIVKDMYEKFEAEVKILAEKTKEFGLDVSIKLLDFIGQDLKAIDMEIKRRDKELHKIGTTYTLSKTEDNKTPFEEVCKAYNEYATKAFNMQTTNIENVIDKAKSKVTELQAKKGSQSKAEIALIKSTKEKTENIKLRMEELIKSVRMVNQLVNSLTALDREIGKESAANLQKMENTLNVVNQFEALL